VEIKRESAQRLRFVSTAGPLLGSPQVIPPSPQKKINALGFTRGIVICPEGNSPSPETS